MPSPPDCDTNATRPGVGGTGAKVAFIDMSGAVFMIPMQLGPISRIPAPRAWQTRSCWPDWPSAPDSAYPAEMTTAPLTPFVAHVSTTPATRSPGTAITARSTGPGTSRTEG